MRGAAHLEHGSCGERMQEGEAKKVGVAGVAVVAWLGLGPSAELAPAAQVVRAQVMVAPVAAVPSTPRLQEYLVAHQAYSPAGPMAGGARNIRTVAVAGEVR